MCVAGLLEVVRAQDIHLEHFLHHVLIDVRQHGLSECQRGLLVLVCAIVLARPRQQPVRELLEGAIGLIAESEKDQVTSWKFSNFKLTEPPK